MNQEWELRLETVNNENSHQITQLNKKHTYEVTRLTKDLEGAQEEKRRCQ